MKPPHTGGPGIASIATSDKVARAIGYRFQNPDLLREAITHSSAARTPGQKPEVGSKRVWNERLEFLGDSVLGLALSAALLKRPENFPEGELSKIRASLVNEQTLAAISRRIGLGQWLILSRGEEKGGGREKSSVLADALEALLGAVFLDGGFEAGEKVVLGLFKAYLEGSLTGLITHDYKSRLQELTQSSLKETPSYEVIDQSGPDHDIRFKIAVKFRDQILGYGQGASKKTASQAAALEALKTLDNNPELLAGRASV